MNHRIAGAVTPLVLIAGAAPAHGRKTQVVRAISLTSLGVYAAATDRDCDIHPRTNLVTGRREWRALKAI